jgi:hypothetical protein
MGLEFLDRAKIIIRAGVGTAGVQWRASIAADERSKKSQPDFLAF